MERADGEDRGVYASAQDGRGRMDEARRRSAEGRTGERAMDSGRNRGVHASA
jgi:hypothetical protein